MEKTPVLITIKKPKEANSRVFFALTIELPNFLNDSRSFQLDAFQATTDIRFWFPYQQNRWPLKSLVDVGLPATSGSLTYF